MTHLDHLGIFLILWGLSTGAVALIKPAMLWKLAKIQSLVRSFGDTGTRLFLAAWAVAAMIGGVALLWG